MLGGSFLLGGLKHRTQESTGSTRGSRPVCCFWRHSRAVPSCNERGHSVPAASFTHQLSVGLWVLLMVGWALGLLFSLKTHREEFSSPDAGGARWNSHGRWACPLSCWPA